MSRIVYGPQGSWRLNRSLGIDILGGGARHCNFDCKYCELGNSSIYSTERQVFVGNDDLKAAIDQIRASDFNYATFSGSGEPTLAENLGTAIVIVRDILKKPVAVLTNASLMNREDVRNNLHEADVVFAKIDAPNETMFHQINRPGVTVTLKEIIEGIKHFKQEYKGKLVLQMMFTSDNMPMASDIAEIAWQIDADEVNIGTPIRFCAIQPLSREEMMVIKKKFTGIRNVKMVYDKK